MKFRDSSKYMPSIRQPFSCGGGGIRTLGAPKGTTVFETAPFDHSGTPPLPDTWPGDDPATLISGGAINKGWGHLFLAGAT